MKILIVDDKVDNRYLLETMLKANQHEVVTAEHGQMGLAVLSASKVDLIISDILMPVMDGYQFCKNVKAQKEWQHIPFVFYTATYTDQNDEKLALLSGANRFLRKPMEPSAFLNEIASIARLVTKNQIDGIVPDSSTDKESLQLYNHRLVHKLEQKMLALDEEVAHHKSTLKALRISEERYRVLFNSGLDAMYVERLASEQQTGRFLEVNKIACTRLGYSIDEFLALTPEQITAPEAWETTKRQLERLREEPAIVYETIRLTKSGERIPVEISAQVFKLNGHNTVLSISRDITDRKKSEAALKLSEERFRLLFEAGSDAIMVYELKPGCIPGPFSEVNNISCRRYGYSAEEFMQMTIDDLVDSSLHTSMAEVLSILAVQDQVLYETLHRKKSGEMIPVEVSAHRFNFYGQNTVMSVARDISERKAAEKELQMLAHAIRSISECVSVTDMNDRILFVNQAFTNTYGYENDEIIGKNVDFLRSEKTPDSIQKQILPQTFSGGWQGEIWNRRKDGTEFRIYLSTSMIINDKGEPLALIGVSRDITEQRNLEEQLMQSQKLESLGQLAGGIAHDFNNLLTVINGTAELALMHLPENDATHKEMQTIFDTGIRANALVRQLLAFSRKQIIEPKILDINKLITNLNKMLSRLIGEDIELRIELSEPIDRIEADPGQIEQVLINLIVNARDAIKAKSNGSSTQKILITTENIVLDESFRSHHFDTQTGPHIIFTVHDTGIGMEKATREKIFEPFFTTKNKDKGTGLGLSTVYGIVKQNKGSIFVYSEPTVGTSFKIYWPAVARDIPITEDRSKTSKLTGGSESILLVEDDILVRKFAVQSLTALGYNVLEAENGKDAVRLLDFHDIQPDLLLTDMIMPGMGGRELSEIITARIPAIKVLFTTGYTNDLAIQQGIIDANVKMLPKPFTVQALAKMVRTVLDE
jgi:two-component system cell cycle sensor histidine kinase/response regulator CckA